MAGASNSSSSMDSTRAHAAPYTCKTLEKYDVIVLGVGAMGSAALYHCAKRGLKVLGLEQFMHAHNQGSSHGLSRIIRLAYHEHPQYVPLLIRAYELWDELQTNAGQELLRITGGLDVADPTHKTADGHNVFWGALESAKLHNLPHEVLSAEQVNARFPGYRLPPQYKAVFQGQSGILAPERCIQAHVAGALAAGAHLLEGVRVTRWRRDAANGDIMVLAGDRCWRADRLVVTCGAWMPQLVNQMKDLLTVERQVVGWFDTPAPELFQPDTFPVFILQDGGDNWYGFPEFLHLGMKIGKYKHTLEPSTPQALNREITKDDEEDMRHAVRKFFPKANNDMSDAVPCMFTYTPDQHFIIDFHPQDHQVVLCSACSGHGFKFSSVIGEILADLAERGRTSHNISLLRVDPERQGHDSLLQPQSRL